MKYTRFDCMAGLAMVTVLILSGCGKIAETQAPIVSESGIMKLETTPTSDALIRVRDLTSFGAMSRKNTSSDQTISDILTQVQIEAGSQDFTAANLFKEYTNQEVIFHTELSGDELARAGAVYELEVVYLEHPVTVSVEIIDTTPPVIEGVRQLWASAGDSVSYKKNILLSDNASGEVSLSVDNSKVNLNTPGTYSVYYIATDAAGNQAKAETTITITDPKLPTEEETNALADELIAQLITDEMSKYDIAYTFWLWCQENMSYSARTEDYKNVWEGAYDGLKTRRGDCYTYCATYSFLLTRCGIENMSISRVGGTTDHKWNLVNCGNGWYHCDASPRRRTKPYQCFMQTDAQVQLYTESYPEKPNYYVFDKSLYPERATTVIYGADPDSAP